jgi:uncharacterized delta-60 repeat protein
LIVGNNLGDTLAGGFGSDTVVGGSGDDVLYAGEATIDLGRLQAPQGISFYGVTELTDGSLLYLGMTTDESSTQVALHYTKSGIYDTAFGTGGMIKASASTAMLNAYAVSGGKFVLIGNNQQQEYWMSRYTSTGQLDPTFGTNGILTPPPGAILMGAFPNMLSDKSLLLTLSTAGNRSIVHYSADGKADLAYGGGLGYIKVPSGALIDANAQLIGTTLPGGFSDGSYLLSGTSTDGTNTPVFIHYTKAGVLDTSFGTNGFLKLDSGFQPASLYVYGDGKILLTAIMPDANGGVSSHYFAGYTAKGQVDKTFGTNGRLTLPDGASLLTAYPLNDSNIMVASSLDNVVALNLYSRAGKLDISFMPPAGVSLNAWETNLAPDGTYWVSGTLDDGTTGVVLHYSKTGALDNGFGNGGKILTPGYARPSAYSSGRNGKQLAGGKFQIWTGSGNELFLEQYLANGQIDTSFGTNGILRSSDGTLPPADLVQLDDGSFIVGGNFPDSNGANSFTKNAYTHYTASGQFDLAFGSDATSKDSLVGGAGNDTLVSSAGVATLDGGTGDNTYYVNNSADVVKQTTQGGGVGTVITSVSYDMGKQAVGVTVLTANSTTGVKITGNALADSITGGTGNDSLIAGAGGSTLRAFGQQGGTQPGGSSEADMMTGGSGADSFVLGNRSGSFYLDSGGYKPGDASYAGINNFDLSKDQLVLSGSQGGYSAVFFSDIKAANTGSDLTTFNQEIAAFTARTGITPSNKDIMLYHGDITTGNADFIAGIHTTTTAGSADDVLTKATFV